MVRKSLFFLLLLGPLTMIAELLRVHQVWLFALAALALIPLAWLIGETTEHAAHHTGHGIGGFLNATFGNAPELIIAYFAVSQGLTEVVRGSLAGSIISNLLLVLGLSLFFGGRGKIDRRSAFTWLTLIALSLLFFLPSSLLGLHGNPDRHTLVMLSLAISVILLLVYSIVTWRVLRDHYRAHVSDDPETIEVWSLRVSLIVLGAATIMTALVAEVLVGTLRHFAEQTHMTEFFVATVIVAIVGNAAEHGGAVIVAARGKIRLATEIALSSSAQVAVFLIPAVAVISWSVNPLSLSFRQAELIAMAASLLLVSALLWRGESSRFRGGLLIAAYIGIVVAFFMLGDRTV